MIARVVEFGLCTRFPETGVQSCALNPPRLAHFGPLRTRPGAFSGPFLGHPMAFENPISVRLGREGIDFVCAAACRLLEKLGQRSPIERVESDQVVVECVFQDAAQRREQVSIEHGGHPRPNFFHQIVWRLLNQGQTALRRVNHPELVNQHHALRLRAGAHQAH